FKMLSSAVFKPPSPSGGVCALAPPANSSKPNSAARRKHRKCVMFTTPEIQPPALLRQNSDVLAGAAGRFGRTLLVLINGPTRRLALDFAHDRSWQSGPARLVQ